MADEVLLYLGDANVVRCASLDEAKVKASSYSHVEGQILVEITPNGGGPVTTLEFDRNSCDWISAT